MTAVTPTLVLDFDGTLCLGDDPIRLYAREIGRHVDPSAGSALSRGLEDFLTGARRIVGAEDGYWAIEILAAQEGISRDVLGRAYRASRRRLAAGEGVVQPPPGIGEFLDEIHSHGHRIVLITNAPPDGVGSWLEHVGIAERLDTTISHANKPFEMREHLVGLLRRGGISEMPYLLASVGDVWVNDVEPAIRLGAHGFHIDRFGSARGPATARATSMADLYPAIAAWAANPSPNR